MAGSDPLFTLVQIDHTAPVPLARQIYEELRAAILDGRLPSGTRLPSTRLFAGGLGISRTTMLGAFAELLADGYVEGRRGSGTYVARVRPPGGADRHEQASGTGKHPILSRRGATLAAVPSVPSLPLANAAGGRQRQTFEPDVPALDLFPTSRWLRLLTRHWRRGARDVLRPADPAGYYPLRVTVAAYIATARGVLCTPDQVVIVAGAQQGLDLAARGLLDPGDAAWIEDPGYLGARRALLAAGARLVPVPVDRDGIGVAAGIARVADARLAYVTPAHQYPLGVQMGLERRVALLDWARETGGVLEDDRDGLYRYRGRSFAAVQGLDAEGRVVHVGTFSPVLAPALRLGYVIASPAVVAALVASRRAADLYASPLDQAALADFIAEGSLVRHIERLRAAQGRRQEALIAAARRLAGDVLEVVPAEAGTNAISWLPPGMDD